MRFHGTPSPLEPIAPRCHHPIQVVSARDVKHRMWISDRFEDMAGVIQNDLQLTDRGVREQELVVTGDG